MSEQSRKIHMVLEMPAGKFEDEETLRRVLQQLRDAGWPVISIEVLKEGGPKVSLEENSKA